MSPNQEAIATALNNVGVEHTDLENESGWCIEVDSPISGDDFAAVMRVVDTQNNVITVVVPNVGLAFQTPYWDAGDVVAPGANSPAADPTPTEEVSS